MNQCSRPCQLAVSEHEYRSEVERAFEFLDTNGRKLTRTLSGIRDTASQELQFELAAQTHRQLDRVKDALAAREDIITEVNAFNGVAVASGPTRESCALHVIYKSCWQEPVVVLFGQGSSPGTSIDYEVRKRLEHLLRSPTEHADKLEHLAVFQRWYRSSWRTGEWLPFSSLHDLNYRKLVRLISKSVSGGAPVTPAAVC